MTITPLMILMEVWYTVISNPRHHYFLVTDDTRRKTFMYHHPVKPWSSLTTHTLIRLALACWRLAIFSLHRFKQKVPPQKFAVMVAAAAAETTNFTLAWQGNTKGSYYQHAGTYHHIYCIVYCCRCWLNAWLTDWQTTAHTHSDSVNLFRTLDRVHRRRPLSLDNAFQAQKYISRQQEE